jgi:glycosidase
LDLAFDFDLANSMVISARSQDNSKISQTLSFDSKIFKPNQFGAFLTNHDQDRVFSQLGEDLSKSRSAAEMLFTMSGVPFIYYGEEIGMSGTKPDEQIRTPMNWSNSESGGFTTGTPWEPSNMDYKSGRNVADETKDPNSLLSLYRNLIHLRGGYSALRVGDFKLVKTDHPAIYAALRKSQDETLMILVNLSTNPVSGFKLSADNSGLQGSYHLQAIFGHGTAANLTVDQQGGFQDYQPVQSLDGNGCLIFQLQAAQ